MELSEHITRINLIIKSLIDEVNVMRNEGHTNDVGPIWTGINDLELDLCELRNAILKESS